MCPAFFYIKKVEVFGGEVGAYREVGWEFIPVCRCRDTDLCLLMFQGDSGRNGEPGSMGPPGPKVSRSYCGAESVIVSTGFWVYRRCINCRTESVIVSTRTEVYRRLINCRTESVIVATGTEVQGHQLLDWVSYRISCTRGIRCINCWNE